MDDLLMIGGLALNGLLAGTYLAFLVAVMPALKALPDDTFVRVMNRINVVIVNPVFLVLFLAAPALAVLVVVTRRDPLGVIAAVAAVTSIVITFVVHLPLNHALAVGMSRRAFEATWVSWHVVRTAAAVMAFIVLCIPGRL